MASIIASEKPIQVHMPFLKIVLFVLIFKVAKLSAKSYIEACSTADKCPAFVSYRAQLDSSLDNISQLFSADPKGVLGANNYDLSLLQGEDFVLPAGNLLKIPISCACTEGILRADSTLYPVKVGDTLYSISSQTYGGLITTQQIQQANGITDGERLAIGQVLIIPFPCACHGAEEGDYNNASGNALKGRAAMFATYAVEEGDSLEQIAEQFEANVTQLMNLNDIGSFSNIESGDVLDVPIPACTSSFGQSAADYGLIVSQGSYVLTAGGCVQCSCLNASNGLSCMPILKNTSCPQKTCSGTNLHIGEVSTQRNASGCFTISCSYGGYKGIVTILRMQINSVACQDGQSAPFPLSPYGKEISPSSLSQPLQASNAGMISFIKRVLVMVSSLMIFVIAY